MVRQPGNLLRTLLLRGADRNLSNMTKTTEAVLAEALRLDQDERAELAAELLSSLDGPRDPGARDAWEVEVRRRVEAIDSGEATLESWDSVRSRIEAKILGK